VSAARLSPAGALAWLHSLSIDLRAAAVLGPGGDCLAGDDALARRAAALLGGASGAGAAGAGSNADGAGSGAAGAAPSGTVAEVRVGDLLAVRSDRHAIAVALGPCALERLARADVRAALTALDGP
jgi:hypothetical protein